MDAYEKYCLEVVRGVVDSPDEVKVVKQVDEMGVLLMVFVAAADMGKVIGKGGTNAQAIKTLVGAAGWKDRANVKIKFMEPGDRE